MRVLATLVLCLVIAPLQALASFARLEAPLAYDAKAETNGIVYEAFLRLGEGHFFVLNERVALPGGAVEERSLTGKWRQTDEGALVRLTSRQGLALRFNVGGAGDLYGHMRGVGAMPVSVRLTRTSDTPRAYALSGTLIFSQAGVSVRDASSGRVVPLEADVRLEALAARDEPLFAEMNVAEHGGIMRLIRLRSVSARLPASILREPDLSDAASGGLWRFMAKEVPPLTGTFVWQGEGRGVLELSGQGMRLQAPYETEGESLTFHLAEKDADMLRAAGFRPLLHLLENVQHWDMEGDLLVLYSKADTVATMEQMIPGGSSAARAGTDRADTPATRKPLAAGGDASRTGWVRP